MSNLYSIHSSTHEPKVLWTVAGSDSCAGAGLQTDLHTFRDFGVVGCSIVSSVTAQHPHGVLAVKAVDESIFRQQFEALLIQGFPNAIKIGLLCNQKQVEILAHYIAYIRQHSAQPLWVVYDPVAVASSGQTLSDSISLEVVQQQLYPLIDLITPNGTELEQLTGLKIQNLESLKQASSMLLEQGVPALLAKGGHFAWQSEVTDYLINPQGIYAFHHQRLDSVNSHGTGCSYASAVASMLAQGFDLLDSVTVATAYLQQGLAEKTNLGQTAFCSLRHLGFPSKLEFFPKTEILAEPLTPPQSAFARTEDQLGLYPVVDSLDWLEKLIKQGVKTLQLRLKNKPLAEIEPLIAQAIALGKEQKVRLFINDFWQLAVKFQAYGVHLGQEDLAQADLNAIQQAGLRLGVSTHGYFEIMRVLSLQPSYIALGHIFPTQTKAMASQPQGLENLRLYLELLKQAGMPSVAIGGINVERLPQVVATGVGSVALVSAITQAQDWQLALQQLQQLMEQTYE